VISILRAYVFFHFILAQPIFTNDNILTQYGEFGGHAVITVYVYSVPKYSTSRWYKSNTQVPPVDDIGFKEICGNICVLIYFEYMILSSTPILCGVRVAQSFVVFCGVV
jgi:hypothetical protein